ERTGGEGERPEERSNGDAGDVSKARGGAIHGWRCAKRGGGTGGEEARADGDAGANVGQHRVRRTSEGECAPGDGWRSWWRWHGCDGGDRRSGLAERWCRGRRAESPAGGKGPVPLVPEHQQPAGAVRDRTVLGAVQQEQLSEPAFPQTLLSSEV